MFISALESAMVEGNKINSVDFMQDWWKCSLKSNTELLNYRIRSVSFTNVRGI
jgi:hypothetical protein